MTDALSHVWTTPSAASLGPYLQMQSPLVMHLNNNSNRQKGKVTELPPSPGVGAEH